MQTACCEIFFAKNNYGEYIIFGRCPILTSILNRGSQSNLPNYRVATYDFHTFLYSTVASVVYQNTMDRSHPFLKSCRRLTNTFSKSRIAMHKFAHVWCKLNYAGVIDLYVIDVMGLSIVYCGGRIIISHVRWEKNALNESREFWNLSRNILYFEPESTWKAWVHTKYVDHTPARFVFTPEHGCHTVAVRIWPQVMKVPGCPTDRI
jgi:hypothetical protein